MPTEIMGHLVDSYVLIWYRLFSQALVSGICPLCCLSQSDRKLKVLLLNPDFKWWILTGETSDPCDTDCDSQINITSKEKKGNLLLMAYAAYF